MVGHLWEELGSSSKQTIRITNPITSGIKYKKEGNPRTRGKQLYNMIRIKHLTISQTFSSKIQLKSLAFYLFLSLQISSFFLFLFCRRVVVEFSYSFLLGVRMAKLANAAKAASFNNIIINVPTNQHGT